MTLREDFRCLGGKKNNLFCRGTTSAVVGSEREKLSLCPECFDQYEIDQDKKNDRSNAHTSKSR